MTSDEQAIRALVSNWMDASRAGDLPRIMEMIDDEVVFLGAGRPPMRGKEGFAAASKAMEGKVRVEGQADVQEVRVFGDWAYVWNQITVTMHPTDGAPATRSGPALAILRKKPDGRWVIFRDANMLAAA